jgi:hypothetical protein
VKESGRSSPCPYAFIVSIFTLLIVGIGKCVFGGCPVVTDPLVSSPDRRPPLPIGLFVILRVLVRCHSPHRRRGDLGRGPCVPPPRAKNAAETLAIMGIISVTMFLSIVPGHAHPGHHGQREDPSSGRSRTPSSAGVCRSTSSSSSPARS